MRRIVDFFSNIYKKEGIKSFYFSKELDMEVHNEILSILGDKKYDDDKKYLTEKRTIPTRYELVKKIIDKKNNDSVMNCLIFILLDKSKRQFWNEIFLIIWGSDLVWDYLKNHQKSNKLIAILWYCMELYPHMGLDWDLVQSITCYIKDQPISDYEVMEDPTITKEMEILRRLYK